MHSLAISIATCLNATKVEAFCAEQTDHLHTDDVAILNYYAYQRKSIT